MERTERARGWARTVRGIEPVLSLWRPLASLRFAISLIGFISVAGLLSVLLPQIPVAMQGNPAAIDAWLEFQKGRFGMLTEPMHRVGLFSVFDAPWFIGALALLAISISVYVVARLPATWRTMTKPQERVPDALFDRGANRVVFETAQVVGESPSSSLEAWLRGRRFRVRAFQAGDTTYLFADRFAWAQLGNFVSHAALILFLLGGVISSWGGYTNALLIAEGETSPVFAVSHPNQMQVEVIDASATFEGGLPVDYRTNLAIYQGGEKVAEGVTTVNDPLTHNGFRFHQAGYLGEGAALRVRDVATGNTLYREVLALDDLVPSPVLTVRDAEGEILLHDVIVPTEQVESVWGTPMTVPGSGRSFWVGVRQDAAEEWQLVGFELGDAGASFLVPEGDSRQTGDLQFTLVEVTGLPATTVPSSVTPAIPGDGEQSLVVMSELQEGTPYVTVMGPVDGYALTLYPDQPVQIGEREYLFEGRREFAGIEVRKDPGAKFIWVAAALLLAALAVTFYVPRLRLWARVRGQETVMTSLAEQSNRFHSETKRLARELGVQLTEHSGEGDTHG